MTSTARQYWWLRLSIFGSGLAALMVVLIGAVRLWPVMAQTFFPAHLSCGCVGLTIRPSWWVVGLTVAVTALAAVSFGRLLWTFVRLTIRGHRQRRDWSIVDHRKVVHARLAHPYTLIESDEPLAVTIGLLRPLIIVSTELVRRLRGSELEAVLAHEYAHRRAHDPLVTALMASLTNGLFWLPWTKSWMAAAYSWRELAADDAATDNYQRTAPLSSAFLKLQDARGTAAMNAFSPNRDRLEKLLDHRWIPTHRVWSWPTLVGLLVAMVALLSMSRSIRAVTQVLPPQAASVCHETVTMCRAERMTFSTNGLCQGSNCISIDRPLISTYAISWAQ